MKRVLLDFACSCIGFAFVLAQPQHDANDQRTVAPQFKIVTLQGEHISSRDLKGRIIVLDFWNSDCPPCRKSMPGLEEFYRKYKHDPRVAFYAVNSGWETMEDARSFASSKRSSFLFFSWGATYDLPFAYDSGGAMLKAFGFNSNPSTVVIDTHFGIRVRHSGFIQNIDEYLRQQVESCLAEQ